MDVTIRPYADADANAVSDLLNALKTRVGIHPFHTEMEIREWSAAWKDIERDSLVVTDADGSIVAFAMTEPPPVGGFRAAAFATVAADWQGRGLGRDLLQWQIDRIGEMHREIAPDADWIVDAGSYAVETEAVRLFQRFGMTLRRSWFDMEAATATVSATSVDGFRVETAESVDAPALFEAHMEAFSDHFGYQRQSFEDWMHHSLDSALFRPELSRIAYDSDEIAGYVLSYDEAGSDRMYVGQVGTRRPWRRRGLASALLSESLVASAKVGKQAVRLGVDATNLTGAVAIYERIGFVVKARWDSYSKPVEKPVSKPA